ncbi:MAG: exodeoxyribonuclease VII large subunit [Firmicutes bacterium]|nr:exodeoxyribonuclease VII large subunit [Bacillota bacterium]
MPKVEGPPIYTVTEINRILKRYLEGEPLFQYVTICGEISNFKHHTSGHMYFVLKDAQSSIRCVMFRGRNSTLRFTPTDGLEVYATGAITIYEAGGIYQLYVEYLEPRGVGDLHVAFEQLKGKLTEEGLFDATNKKPLPFLPRRIGIVTSPTGAAIQDMISILTRRMPSIEILIAPALVQGRSAAASIVASIDALVKWGDCDVIIVGRGGGSLEDLWPFNEEAVARAVFGSPVPVISAVGHETDVTICDFVADLRAPTPSAAAELAVPLAAALQQELKDMEIRLEGAWFRYYTDGKEKVANLERVLNSYNPVGVLRERQQRLDELSNRLVSAMDRQLTGARQDLAMIMQRLDGLSPLAVVGRGYGIVSHSETHQPIVSIEQVQLGEDVDVMLQDGTIVARIGATKPSRLDRLTTID